MCRSVGVMCGRSEGISLVWSVRKCKSESAGGSDGVRLCKSEEGVVE